MKDLPIWFQEMGALDTLFGYDDRVPLLYKEEKSPTELDWLEEVSADFEGLDFDNTYVDNDQTMAEFRKLFIARRGEQLFRYGMDGPVFLRRPKFWDEIFGNFETKNRFPFATLSHELVLALVYLTNTADQHEAWGETKPGSPESHNVMPFDLTDKEDLKILLQAVETILQVQQGKKVLDPTGQYLVSEVDQSEAIDFLENVERLQWRVSHGYLKQIIDDPLAAAVDSFKELLLLLLLGGVFGAGSKGGLAGMFQVLREAAELGGRGLLRGARTLKPVMTVRNLVRGGSAAVVFYALEKAAQAWLVSGDYEAYVNELVMDRALAEHRQSLGLNWGTLWRGPTYLLRSGARWLQPTAEEAAVADGDGGDWWCPEISPHKTAVLAEDRKLSEDMVKTLRVVAEFLIYERGQLRESPEQVFSDLVGPVDLGKDELALAEQLTDGHQRELRRYFAQKPLEARVAGEKFLKFLMQYTAARLHFIDQPQNDWVREIFNQDGTLKQGRADKLLQTLSPKTADALQRITRHRQAKPKQPGRGTQSKRAMMRPSQQNRWARSSDRTITQPTARLSIASNQSRSIPVNQTSRPSRRLPATTAITTGQRRAGLNRAVPARTAQLRMTRGPGR